ncbi:MAG: tetratricopeptide repeat protein, partial [Anaerolineae bacterium]|nr:tetratricopeptide repeat protein [Anaerolineae bacterium]
MASQDQTANIQQAARLMKAGQKAQAYALLKGVLAQNPRDWRAWWGLVHAATDKRERYQALQRTVQLNPNHAKASQLLRQIEARQQASAQPTPAAPPPTPPPAAEPAPWDNPFADVPAQDTAPAQASASAQAPVEESAPWDNPFEAVPAQASASAQDTASAGASPWDNPFETAVPANTSAGLADPFGAPPAAASSTQAWSGPAYTIKDKPSAKKQGSSNDAILNVAIAIVGVLVIVGLIALVVTQVDFSGLVTNIMTGGAPNTFDGGDPYRTSGGGELVVNGGNIQDGVYDLNEAHNWVFEGEAGQTVVIIAEGIDGSDPRVRLLDPNGVRIAE